MTACTAIRGLGLRNKGAAVAPLFYLPPRKTPHHAGRPEFVLGSFSRSCECYFLFSRKTFAHLSLVVNGALRTAILLEAE